MSKDALEIKYKDDDVRERLGCGDIDDDEYLEHLVDRLEDAGDRKHKITVGEILEVVGPCSFGPLLIVVGLLITSPLSGIPLFPTVAGAVVLMTTLQLLFGRRNVWLPKPVLNLSVPKSRFRAAMSWLHTPARAIDRYTEPRMPLWVHGRSVYIIALVCMVLASLMPLMEFVPFSATLAGVMLTTFGVALVARDGLLCVLGYGMTGAIIFMIVTFIS